MSKPKEITIFYFSGTGNAKRIALWLSQFAAKEDIPFRIFNIEKSDSTQIKPDALIVIISPVHGFNFPKIMLGFIAHLPKGGNNVVLMNTRAGMKIGRFVTPGITGVAFLLSSLLLKPKGYKIVGQIPFDMPSNWLSVHPSLNENTVRFIHEKNYYRLEKHAAKIFSGKKDFAACKDLIQDILISPVSLGYYLAGRFVFAKSFYASDACDNCGLCIKECPVSAIKNVNDHPFWTFKCESCMKCMSLCPKRAIETAHGLFLFVGILFSGIASYLFYTYVPLGFQSGLVKSVLYTLVFIVFLWLFYYIQHLLLKNKFIAKLISFTSLTHYKFWGRYRSIPDKKWKE